MAEHPFAQKISAVFRNVHDAAVASGAAGVVMSAGLFALAGLALSGVGLLVAGPLVAALAGGAAGAMVGGLYGGLVGFGFSEESARAYERAIQEGAIAIVIMTHNDPQSGS